jgi:beta-xylosidase
MATLLAPAVLPRGLRAVDGAARPAAPEPFNVTNAVNAPTSPPRTAAVKAPTYTNPLPVDLADPHVIRSNGTYYLYATSAPSEGFLYWTSDDLVSWKPGGFAFRKSSNSWGRDHFWAPCVLEHRGAFYLFYNAVGPVGPGRTSHRICVAKSDSPSGPFVDVRTPLFDIGQAVIDAHAFVDRDGSAWLYYSLDISENPVSEVFVVPLSSDLLSVTGTPTPCIRPSQPWEGRQWNEAPFVWRVNDTYVMTYSGRGFFDPLYAVGYATAPSPQGPWTKAANNPILRRTDDVAGPGHNCVTTSPDGRETFVVYHTHKSLKGGCPRELAIDRLNVVATADGVKLSTPGPTRTPQPMPSTAGTRELVATVAE